MIKILHTGDIHLGDLAGPTKDGRNLRREDTIRCMEEIYCRAFLEEPDLTIIAGDLFNRSRVWADTALEDVNDALERFIIPLCKCSDAVVLLFGTMNHDNPRAFELIKRATRDLKNLHIYTEPKVEEITTSSGAVQIVIILCFLDLAVHVLDLLTQFGQFLNGTLFIFPLCLCRIEGIL